MNNKLKNILITGLVFTISGILLVVAGVVMGGLKYARSTDINSLKNVEYSKDSTPEYHFSLKKTKLESFKNIQANMDEIDLKIKPSDNNKKYISYDFDEYKKYNPIKYYVYKDTLYVKERRENDGYISVNLGFINDFLDGNWKSLKDEKNNAVTVYLPEDEYLDIFYAKLEYSDITIDGLYAEKTKIINNDGDVSIKNSIPKEADIMIDYGDLSLDSVVTSKFKLENHNGDAKIKDSDLSDVDADFDYGDFNITDSRVDVSDIRMDNGDFASSGINLIDKNTVNCSYGDFNLGLNEVYAENISMKITTSYGDISVSDSIKSLLSSGVCADSEYKYKAQSEQGSLIVNVDNGDINLDAK